MKVGPTHLPWARIHQPAPSSRRWPERETTRMTLTIELTPDMTTRLREAARRQGLETPEYARRLIETHLPDAKGLALASLMQQWIEEDAAVSPEESARRDAEWEELKSNLNAHRADTGGRLLFP